MTAWKTRGEKVRFFLRNEWERVAVAAREAQRPFSAATSAGRSIVVPRATPERQRSGSAGISLL